MLSEILILMAPVAALAVLMLVWARWDTKRWEARTQGAARVSVRLFPTGGPTAYPPLDTRAGRAARRARHDGEAR